MKYVRTLMVALLVMSVRAGAEEPASGTPLNSPDDWYDCAAFFILLIEVETDNPQMVRLLGSLRWVAQVKGEELAKGSDAVPPPESLDLSRKEGPNEADRRVRYFHKTHLEEVKKGPEAAAAHTKRYVRRCMVPTLEVSKRIKQRKEAEAGQGANEGKK